MFIKSAITHPHENFMNSIEMFKGVVKKTYEDNFMFTTHIRCIYSNKINEKYFSF